MYSFENILDKILLDINMKFRFSSPKLLNQDPRLEKVLQIIQCIHVGYLNDVTLIL